MYRGRGGGYRGRGGYHHPRGRGNYHHNHEQWRERDHVGRDRGRRYERSRSRSPRRYRSRSRSRSRERYRDRDDRYKNRRSMSPSMKNRNTPDSEGLRITIQPKDSYRESNDKYYHEERERDRHQDRDRRRRSKSSDKHRRSVSPDRRRNRSRERRRSSSISSNSSYSRSKIKSPPRGRSKERSEPRRADSEETLRITVGNDRYLQKPSAVERLGPPVKGVDRSGRPQGYENVGLQRVPSDQFALLQGGNLPDTRVPPPHLHDTYQRGSSLERTHQEPGRAAQHTRESSVPVSLHEDDLYSSRSDLTNDPYSCSSSNFPRRAPPVKEPALPLVPGLAQTLDIDDEDKFLYGDNEDDRLKEETERHKPSLEPVSLSKMPAAEFPDRTDQSRGVTNQFGDQDYRMRSSQHQQFSRSEDDLYEGPDFRERTMGRERGILRNTVNKSETFNFKGESYPVTDYQHQAPPGKSPPVIDREPDPVSQSDDPTLQNILKSIGFNFELSKLMQEKAQQDREKHLKRQELEHIVKKGDSFMDGGLKGMDLQSVFHEKDDFEEHVRRREAREAELRCLEEAKRGTKRSIIGSAETYEQMAKKYREEQARALENDRTKTTQGKLHPLDYLTNRGRSHENRQEGQFYDEPGARKDTISANYSSRGNKERFGDSPKHYSEKLFEDDVDFDNRKGRYLKEDSKRMERNHSHSREEIEDSLDRRYGIRDRDQDIRPKFPMVKRVMETSYGAKGFDERPELYNDVDETKSLPYRGKDREEVKFRSPRDQRAENESHTDLRRSMCTSSPDKKLAENDLRNVLIASDKASKRIVLAPKSERELVKQTQSPKPEEPPQKRVLSMLSAKEREQLEREKEKRMKRLTILENELDKLRKQQGEMMRKKQRQKDGHKDPLLVENSKLQDEITKQITVLRKAVENQPKEESKPAAAAVKFKMEKVPKVVKGQTALVESSSESDGDSKSSNQGKNRDKRRTSSTEKPLKSAMPLKEEKSKSKKQSSSPTKRDQRKLGKVEKTEGRPKPKFHVNYEFFDPGNHWCRKCNVVCSNVFEVFQHLTKKQHFSKMDNYDRPWMPDSLLNPKPKTKKGQSVAVPIQGVEFMMSTQAFFCRLCKVFSGDATCAEDHLKSDQHNKNYQAYVNDNPFYEQRMKLDKAAGISTATRDIDEKDEANNENKKKDNSKIDDLLAAQRVAQQKRAIERQLREKEEEEKMKKKEREDQAKKSVELLETGAVKPGKDAKGSAEKVRLEFPPTGKIGKMTWAKQQQRLQEKIKQRQEEAKEREAAQQKSKLQFSFGRAPPTFPTGAQGPRVDATTFIKKLKEERERNHFQDKDSEADNLDTFLTVGDSSLPVVAEAIPLPKEVTKPPVPRIDSAPAKKSEMEIEREEDLKLLGIDPDSTTAMDIRNKPPAMASRKPVSDSQSPKPDTSSLSLYNVLNPSSTASNGDNLTALSSSNQPINVENGANDSSQREEENHQVDDMDLGSEGSISMTEFEVLDEVA